MKQIVFLLLTCLVFTSCGEYQKVLKSNDVAKKFSYGEMLYDKGKYDKANRLFEQLVPQYRGKPQAEKLMYLYASSYYHSKDYALSGYQFERFASSYPNSEKAEEALFLGAKSSYMLSPEFDNDQQETKQALQKLQQFINVYPNSAFLDETNQMVRELNYKLELKAYSIAKQYNKISDFKAAIKSFDIFIIKFPGSKLREDALYYRFDSLYHLAINSVDYLKKERLINAKGSYDSFVAKYKNSQYLEQAQKMNAELEEQLKLQQRT